MNKSKTIATILAATFTMSVFAAGCGSSSAGSASTQNADGSTETAATEPSNRLEEILAEGKITNVCEPYFAPYEFIDNTKTGQEQYRGADMEFARYIAEVLGVELEIVPLQWDAVLTGVTEGKYDMAVAGLGYSEERAQNMELTDVYKQGSEQGLLIRAEDSDLYNTLADFAGKKVGFQSGTIQEQLATAQLPDSDLQTYDLINNAVLALDAGKIDAVSVSIPNGEMFVQSNPNLQVFTGEYFEQGKNGNCIAVPKGETELRDRLNEIIADVQEQGLYDEWLEQARVEAEALGIETN